MSVKRSVWGLQLVVVLALAVSGCAPARHGAPRVHETADYTRSVVARGQHFGGGLAVLSSPEGDVLFVPNQSGIDELDGDTGKLRRRHASPLPHLDNVARAGKQLVLLSADDDRVALWDPASDTVLDTFGGYAAPVNAARFRDGLLVAELERGGISLQGNDGGEAATFAAGMRCPAGLAGTTKDLWVGDRASGTVLQLVANGEPLEEPVVVVIGLSQPEGLGITPGGSLIVAETGAGRLLYIDHETRTVRVIDDHVALDAAPGAGRNPIGTFAGVAVGACGTIYVTADASGEIIRYVPNGPAVCQYGE